MRIRRGNGMTVDLVFKIAAIGVLVAVLGQVLTRAGREDIATLATLAGLIVVLMVFWIYLFFFIDF